MIIKNSKRIAIIGAGPAGATFARIAADQGNMVTIFDKREHIGGNCYDYINDNKMLVHKYGPHYFRSDNKNLLEWLSQFTDWLPAQYIVKASLEDKLISMPINLSTMIGMTGKIFDENEFRQYLKQNVAKINKPKNAEEHCLANLGDELYQALFKNYTIKQWGTDPKNLDPSITARIPLRFTFDEKYPQEKFQVIPKEGYTKMFERILDDKKIKIELNKELGSKELRAIRNDYDLMIYTGPIDHFYDYKFGKLEYRSLRFEWKDYDESYRQPCVQINYPNDHEYTRSVEIKHVTGQQSTQTTICYEYPVDSGDPFYPMLNPDNIERYREYFSIAQKERSQPCPVHFVGRLAEFKYYNMDHVFLISMDLAKKVLEIEKNNEI